VRESNRQRVGGIGRRIFREPQHRPHHKRDLRLLRSAPARGGGFHAARRVFVNRKPGLGQREQRGPARRTERDRRLIILEIDDPLHGGGIGLVLLKKIRDLLMNRHETSRRHDLVRILNHAIRQRARRPPLDRNNAITRAPQRGVKAEDHGHGANAGSGAGR